MKGENLTSLWSKKLHYKFIESTEDGDFMLALDAVGQLRRIASRQHTHKQTQTCRTDSLIWLL